jgi:phosphoglycerol transferase
VKVEDATLPRTRAVAPVPGPSDGWRPYVRDGALVTALTLAVLAILLKLWDQPLDVPFTYIRDGISETAVVKGILDHGWNQVNPSLGFPFSLDFGDYPLGSDNAHWLFIKVIGVFTSDATLVLNLYFLLSFVLISLSAFFVLRKLGISRWLGVAAAVLYSFLPYHVLRGSQHIHLGAYWSVPVGCLLVVLALRDPPPFFRRDGDRLLADLRSKGTLLFVLGCVLLGSTGLYYAAFTAVLAVSVAVLRSLSTRDWRPVAAALALSVVIGGTLVANNLPSIVHRVQDGANPEVAQRIAAEADNYALRPIQLIAPIPGHRIDAFARVTAETLSAPINSEGTSYLGLIGAVGFVALVLVGLTVLVGRPSSARAPDLPVELAVPTLIAIVFGVSGGLSWGFGLAGIVEIRAWNRLSVFIGFFALAALAWWGGRLAMRLRSLQARPLLVPAAALLLVVVGVLDQTSAAILPDARPNEAAYESDRRFVESVEAELAPGSAVYQLPFLPFPEAELETPPYGMTDYDPLRGYLHSDSLRWSYGGMRGRESDWQESVSSWPVPDLLDAVTAVGFRGLWIDRLGYRDRARRLERQVVDVLRVEPIVSDDDRFSFFSLAAHASGQRRLLGKAGVEALRRDVLAVPRVRPVAGLAPVPVGVASTALAGNLDAELAVRNRDDAVRKIVITGRIRSTTAASGTVQLRIGPERMTIPVTMAAAAFEWLITLDPGDHVLRILTTLSSDVDGVRFVLEDLEARPAD